ncbi:hypothetical protein I4U23_012865 [Adineta vaga]|nr:hypothetical protein I4U23_012865 [Adineta vaga]
MSVSNDDLSKINFDSQWECLQQSIDKFNDADILSLATMNDNYQWSSIKLPHFNEQNNNSTMNSNDWWYRKQFHWISSDQQVYLNFKPSQNTSNNKTTIWLNQTEIFSGSLMSLQKSIELTPYVLIDEDSNNTLLIYCSNMTLSYHLRLLIYGKVIYASGQIQVDENPNPTQENKNVLQYTVSLADNDGRISVDFDTKQKYNESEHLWKTPIAEEKTVDIQEPFDDDISIPRLAIVILIVGTRGDVQPFIALGQALRTAGHRVRLATHETFRSFVRGNGLEFYPLAGDPADLMEFMVKNAGIVPSMSSIIAGDVTKKRQSLSDILTSTWNACIADDDETSLPFRAEAIIANPPSFGHIHCAEKLRIPLHIMFTMPYSPTSAFPHPLCNIESCKGPMEKINRYSYDVIEMLTWSGMGDIVNKFRKKILNLSTIRTRQAVRAMVDERVPHTYCWSPSIVSKPHDWGSHINVSGFFFLNLGTAYTDPPLDLLNFLGLNIQHTNDNDKLPPPIYIGFGSITGHDSNRLLKIIIEVLAETGYRALLAGFKIEAENLPSNIFLIGNVPHDWLFQHVSAVCHHGGAGTTAAGLRAGKPTIIVPFFGDQFFWGSVIERSGAGPNPLPGKSVTVEQLVDAFKFVHTSAAREAAERIRVALLEENGCETAVHIFHASLPLLRIRSDLESTFAACYRVNRYNIQISRPVAQVLVSSGMIEESDLTYHITREWQFAHNNKVSVPTHGIIQHTSKALSSMFTDTKKGIKQVTSSDDLLVGAKDAAETVVKGVGRGLGHISIGCLTLYGEITDVLDRVPSLYDPYSEPSTYKPHRVTGFKSGVKVARQSLWYGWKDGVTGIVKEPFVGYKRHGILGGAGGALLGTVNVLVKPTTATLSSVTWLSRGTYATVKKAVKNCDTSKKNTENKSTASAPSSPMIGYKQQQHERDINFQSDNDDHESIGISQVAKIAAEDSGFHPRLCQQILDEFTRIKSNQECLNPNNIASSLTKFIPQSLRL